MEVQTNSGNDVMMSTTYDVVRMSNLDPTYEVVGINQ